MSNDLAAVTKQALALPPADRVRLAQDLWQSVNGSDVNGSDRPEPVDVDEELRIELRRRAAELDQNTVERIPHDEVMQAARKAIGCE